MSALAARLAEYDGTNISTLSEAQAQCGAAPDYWDDLLALAASPEPHLSDGATWIISDELKSGAQFGTQNTEQLVSTLEHLSSWQAQLHLCQSLEHVAFSTSQATRVRDWSRDLLTNSRPFLRAWALHLFIRLCLNLGPEELETAFDALDAADADTAASVRARARNLRKLPALRL